MKQLLATALLCAATLTAQAANSDTTNASDSASMASAIVLVGSMSVLAAGTAVTVVAVSTGHMLMLSGKAIAYVPNAAGNAILHHSKA